MNWPRGDIEFIGGDLRELANILDDTALFSGAICLGESGFGVLGGATEDLRLLYTVRAKLRDGGNFVLTTFNGLRRYVRAKDSSSFDFINGTVEWVGPEQQDGLPLRETIRVYIPSELKILFQLAGFKETKISGCEPVGKA